MKKRKSNKKKLAYRRAYYQKNRTAELAYRRAYYQKNRTAILEDKDKKKLAYRRAYYQKNRTALLEDKKQYHTKNRAKILKAKRAYRTKKLKKLGRGGLKKQDHERYRKEHDKAKKVRKKVISYYSNRTNKCACCGVKGSDFLTIDHVVPKRKMDKDPKMIAIGYSSRKNPDRLIFWLDRHRPKGFQVLCWNCNYAKGANGKCPHLTSKN